MAREKHVKNNYIAARIDTPTAKRIDAYVDEADMDVADLIRRGIREFMDNHPLKGARQAMNPTGGLQ